MKYIYIYIKEDEPPHFNKDIFSRRFFIYNTIHWLDILPPGWAAAGQPQNVKNVKKCLFNSEKPVKHSTFGPQLATQHHAVLWGHSKVKLGGCNGVNISINILIPIKV